MSTERRRRRAWDRRLYRAYRTWRNSDCGGYDGYRWKVRVAVEQRVWATTCRHRSRYTLSRAAWEMASAELGRAITYDGIVVCVETARLLLPELRGRCRRCAWDTVPFCVTTATEVRFDARWVTTSASSDVMLLEADSAGGVE
jgi:hypothetical protein